MEGNPGGPSCDLLVSQSGPGWRRSRSALVWLGSCGGRTRPPARGSAPWWRPSAPSWVCRCRQTCSSRPGTLKAEKGRVGMGADLQSWGAGAGQWGKLRAPGRAACQCFRILSAAGRQQHMRRRPAARPPAAGGPSLPTGIWFEESAAFISLNSLVVRKILLQEAESFQTTKVQLRLESRGPSSSAETLCVVDISHNFPKKTRLASRTFQLWAAVCLLDELQVQTVVDGSSNCRLIHLRSGSVRYSCRRTCSFSAVSEMQSSSLDVPTLNTWLPGLPLAFWWPLTLTPSLKLLLSPIPSDTTSKDQKKKKNKEKPERNAAAEQGWSNNQQKVFMAQPLHHSN